MNHFKYIFSFNHKRYKCNNYYASKGGHGRCHSGSFIIQIILNLDFSLNEKISSFKKFVLTVVFI